MRAAQHGGRTLNALAAEYATTGNLTGAAQLCREALATEHGQALQVEYAHAHAGIGEVHADLGEHDRAREHRRRALAIYRDLGMPQADTVTAKLDRPTVPTSRHPALG